MRKGPGRTARPGVPPPDPRHSPATPSRPGPEMHGSARPSAAPKAAPTYSARATPQHPKPRRVGYVGAPIGPIGTNRERPKIGVNV